MGEPSSANGDVHSRFLSHLTSYPVISDSITSIKKNPYGQKSLAIADQGYSSLSKSVPPYIGKQYQQYLRPIVVKADSLGDEGLNRVESRFPIVKENTESIRGLVGDYISLPFRLVGDGKQRVFNTYKSEYQKCGGDGYVAYGKAFITTGLTMTSESLVWLSQLLVSTGGQGQGQSAGSGTGIGTTTTNAGREE